MKNIYLIRHAKAEDPSLYDRDFNRPLSNRGFNDAKAMADRLQEHGVFPDYIISSPALRTMQTIQSITELLHADKDIITEALLYLPSYDIIDQVISSIPTDDNINTVFIITHNFGITEYANFKISNFSIDNVPTCGIVGFTLPIATFANNNLAIRGTLNYLDYPKKK